MVLASNTSAFDQPGTLGVVILAASTGYRSEQACLPAASAGCLATLVVIGIPQIPPRPVR